MTAQNSATGNASPNVCLTAPPTDAGCALLTKRTLEQFE